MHKVLLCEVSVDPVQDVQSTVRAQQCDVVACEVVHVLRPYDHCELWQDGDGLKVDGRLPQNLQGDTNT